MFYLSLNNNVSVQFLKTLWTTLVISTSGIPFVQQTQMQGFHKSRKTDISKSVHPSNCLPIHLSKFLSINLSLCLSIYL